MPPASTPDRLLRLRALLAVVVAGVLVLTLTPASPAAAQDAPPVQISPTRSENTAVHADQTIEAEGRVGEGELTAARLVGVLADGSTAAQPVPFSDLNREDGPLGGGGDFLRVDGGELSGRLTLGCLFAAPRPDSATFCPERPAGSTADTRRVILEVTVGGRVLQSQPLRVDYTQPRFRDALLTGTRTVVVRFTEPVRTNDGTPDAPIDFEVRVGGAPVPVASVTGPSEGDCVGTYGPGEDPTAGPTGCTRTLTLGVDVDEDAIPSVDYVRNESRLNTRDYEDFADNTLVDIGTGARTALDRIRPPLPTISSVDDEAPTARVDGRSPAPVLGVSNLRAGHTVYVERVPTEGGPVRGDEVVAGEGGTATVTAPQLPTDGPHVLRVVARDPSGNLSTETNKSTARPDGGPSSFTYVLDTVVPTVVGALAELDGRVRVLLSEDVTGPNDPSDFAVRVAGRLETVTAVEGSGSSRLLTVEGGAPAGARLDYTPGEGPRYADPAGNLVPDRLDVLVAGLAAPVVDVPAGQVFTSAGVAPVAGSLPGPLTTGVVVDVFADADRDGRPDGAALASAPVDAEGRWGTDVALDADARNELLVRARDAADELRGPPSAVPTIVQDRTAPRLQLQAPVGGEVLAGGEPTTVSWSTSDTNPGTVLVELSTDGTTFVPAVQVPASADGTQSVQVELPDVDTAAARVRLISTDRAGNPTTQVSLPFTIDALAPAFTGVTSTSPTGPTDVRLAFTEPVSGPIAPGDFVVDGQPASVVSIDGPASTPAAARGATVLVLRVPVPFSPDAEPRVAYAPSPAGQLEDRAGQGVEPAFRAVDAFDGIRPPTPTIETVEGRPADGPVTGRAVQPSLTVSGVAEGHVVQVQRLVAGAATASGTEVTATGSTVTAQAPLLPADGGHLLRVVVRDVNRNLSTDDKPVSPADGGPSEVTYRLDTVAPQLVAAVSADDQATVLFSELVSGPDDPAHFSVPGRTVERVEGRDGERTRVLTVSGGSLAGLPLTYAPSAGRYVDAAGNGVPDATVTVDGVPAPVVLQPAGPVFTPEQQITVAGTVRTPLDGPPRAGTVVDVLRDTDGDGDGDAFVVRGVPVDGAGAWSTALPLDRNARHSFVVRSRATDGAVADSADVAVPLVTQDDLDPRLDVTSPQGGEVLAGGARSTVRWTTSDTNPRELRVELTTDGTTFTSLGTIAPPADGAGELPFTVPDVDTAAAQVRVTALDRAGNSTQRLSQPFAIDALAPTFVAVTTAPRTIRLTFSEPVSGRVAPLTDFRVDGQPATVTSIEGSPSFTAAGARTFVLNVPAGFGEDATPTVTYTPTEAVGQLVDRAQQGVVERVVTAVDGIRPAVPTVTAVDGRQPADGRVLGGAVVPQVSVSNLVPGQFVRVERVPTAGLPVAGPELQTQGGTALVPAPRLPDDGEHLLRVVVRDATGNTSTDTAKTPGRGDGGPSAVTYVLDTQLPAVLFAVADNDQITVRFTEPLFPAGGDPADWRVTRPDGSPVPLGDRTVTVNRVSGSGDTRVLDATGVQPGSLLVYSPRGERYADANANPLPDTTTPLLALTPPVVTTPSRALFVTTDSTTVAGTSEPGSTVSLLRRGRDGGPSGTAVATARTGEDGRWSLTAPLELDRANDFLVQARRTDGRDTIAVPVPTITQDGVAPVLSVTGLPGDQERLDPGSARTLGWSVCDANLGATPMTLEFSADDGATWVRLGPERLASPNDCAASTSRRVTLPGTGETSTARLRVSATDLAGRTTRVVSPRFALAGATLVRDVRGFACPPDRVRPAGFTDTSTSTFRFEIDCLAAYQFTKGVTADRYEPLGNVTRAQMALFVARVAAYAGVPLDTSDAGFNDVGDRSQETRDAINALANLGVVEGVGGGRYAPAQPVSRGQMASFLARVQQRVGAPFPTARDGFRDDDRTTHEENINLIAGAGVVQGISPGIYQPLASITRQQMAGFLIRYVDGQIEAGEMRSAYQ